VDRKMAHDYKVEIDTLAVGLTRPPIFMGVNLRLFFSAVIFCVLICLDTHSFYGIPIFIFLYIVMLRMSAKDINFFTLWVKGFSKTPPVMNSFFWGGTNSYSVW
jgi:type IV secretion system protein VirB3